MSLNGKKTNLRQTVIPRPREQPFGSSSGGTLFTKPQQDRDTLPSSSNNNASLLKTLFKEAPQKSFEPKVYVPYKHSPGAIPRQVIVERLRRQYEQQDIEELLRNEGIDYSKPITPERKYELYLPLDAFDNTDFDIRQPHEWIKQGLDEDGKFIYVPAMALQAKEGVGNWHYCKVYDVDEVNNKYLVDFVNQEGNRIWLPRIYVMFLAENPVNFAKRVAHAHKSRKVAESLIRYFLYIEHMPSDDSSPLTEDQSQNIRRLGCDSKRLREKLYDSTTDDILEEIIIEYQAVANRMIFDKNMKDPLQKDLFKNLELPEEFLDPSQKKVPYLATISIPPYPFTENSKQFSFNSYFTERNILDALLNVKRELLEKQIFKIFHIPLKKTVTLDEFEQIQIQAIDSIVSKLTGEWLGNLKQHIQDSLIHIEKGWLSVAGKTVQIYEMSKLKRFMNTIRFMMQDSIKFLMQDSFKEYVKYIEEYCTFDVQINSVENVEVKFHHENDSSKRAVNLFSIELSFKDDKFFFITPTERFKAIVVEMFDKALKDFQKISDVESHVLSEEFCERFSDKENDDKRNKRNTSMKKSHKMFLWGEVKMLDTLKPTDEEVINWRRSLDNLMSSALQPLNDFLKQFEQYEDLLRVDVQKFMEEYEKKDSLTIDDIKAEILKNFEMKDKIRESIPQKVNMGTFLIDCQSIRNHLSRKCSEIGKKILDYLARTASEKCNFVLENFNKLSREINKPPEDIESLTKLKQRLKEIPDMVLEYEEKIIEMKNYYTILENEFKYPLSDEEFKNLWTAATWPKKVQEQIEKVESFLEKKKENLRERLVTDQKSFMKELESITKVVSGFSKHRDILSVAEVAKEVKTIQKQLQDFQDRARKNNQKEILFGMDITEHTQLNAIVKQFQPYADLWLTVDNYFAWEESWSKEPFENLDAPKIEEEVKAAEKAMLKCMKQFKEIPEIRKISETIKKKVEEFTPYIPLVLALRNPGMRQRHWQSISNDIGIEIIPGQTLKFMDDVFTMKLLNHEDVIKKYSDIASREYTIEKALKDMQEAWESCLFEVVPYRKTGTYVMKVSDEIQQQLSEHIALTQTISFSSFKKHFEADLKAWENQLYLVSEIFEEWANCQREWMALEPIFSAEEMQNQLPQLYKQFKQVDVKWRRIMDGVFRNPNIMSFCTTTAKLLKTFQSNNSILSVIQKGLSNYLEKKRQQFARLYFLADEELLEILAKTRDPTAVQKYLSKIFEGIGELDFVDIPEERKQQTSSKGPALEMVAMMSKAGERVEFKERLQPTGSVEVWLKEVERVMCGSLKETVSKSLIDYNHTPRNEWVLKWPGQVVILGSQVYWTKDITQALNSGGNKGLRGYLDVVKEQLLGLIRIVRTDISKLEKTNIEGLITIEVHARDVVEQMLQEGIQSTHDFEWVSQMRYYWEPKETYDENGQIVKSDDFTCYVRQVETQFEYGYEYLGNTSRLVITPLTDRIYLTLTGALHLGLGGAPAGPAGTGKTETVKDLAKALAKKCVVLNCQEGMRENSMAQIFKGLVQSGSWGCFDEFNRIDVEVLSVVAQQLSTLQEAARARLATCQFDNTTINVDPSYAVFITMNPGYAGRTELPDNLKALFRPVACMVPDYRLIAEIRLISFGFENAKPLSNKMVQSFKLASEQLSSQTHYDFGMRAVNTVIAAAGLLKRKHLKMNEEVLVLRALRDSNIPKFLVNDVILFNGIVSDLFPKVQIEATDYEKLNAALLEATEHFGIKLTPVFHEKCLQLYETTILRHGVMLVGNTGGGKTMCYKTLAHALTTCSKTNKDDFHPVHYSVINPKSVTMEQLYGEYDKNTREWRNGVLAAEFRKFGEDTTLDCKWLIFDGPVDALWIESMNTVLDENKKLCLSNGSMIEMSVHMNIVFEVEDLAEASPATVSRCGMVYLDPKATVPPMVHVDCWLNKVSSLLKPYHDQLRKLFEIFLPEGIDFIRYNVLEYIPTVDSNLAHSTFKILDTLFVEYDPSLGRKKKKSFNFEEEDKGNEAKMAKLSSLIEPYFLFAITWGIGASCDYDGRKSFDKFMRKTMKENSITSVYPDEGLVYDYFFDSEDVVWKNWAVVTPELEINNNTQFRDMIVPTIDTMRSSWLVKKLIQNDNHVLCVGPTGTGKSQVISQVLLKEIPEEFIPLVIFFSARTEANAVQNIIDAKLDRRRPGVYGPPQGRKYIIFIDDINMPTKEQYGAQPPIELVRQWMDHSGWYEYSNERLPFRMVENLTYIAACGPPGGGRNTVTNRLMRHFTFISFPEMQHDSLSKIFSTILNKSYIEPNTSIKDFMTQEISTKFVDSSIELFNIIRKEMLPTPSRSHYTFNLRDLSKVFQGILQANPKKILNMTDILKLWTHESSRVFKDRLVDNPDRRKFEEIQEQLLTKFFPEADANTIVHQRLIYSDILSHGNEVRTYDQVSDHIELLRIVNEQLGEYNINNNEKKMDLVMFLDAIEHVCKIGRIIRQPGGNALLLGVGGSGRQSLTKLACFIASYDMMQLEIRKSFSLKDWKEFLKVLLLNAGKKNGKGENTVFLLADTQIIYESFLEDINNLLNSGEVPNLFEAQDFDEIYTAMKPICAIEKLPATPLSWYNRFIKCVQDNLHIVLAMSPIGETFRSRLRMFPSLVNCCTIDWFSEWPKDALLSVANEKLSNLRMISVEHDSQIEETREAEEDLKERVNQMFVYIHQSVEKASVDYLRHAGRTNYVTPTSYLELLNSFNSVLDVNRKNLEKEKRTLQIGLKILRETEEYVHKLQEDLKIKRPQLDHTRTEIDKNMITLNKEREEAQKTQEIVQIENAEANKIETEAKGMKQSAEEELSQVEPLLEKAVETVKNIKVNQIREVANYKVPPSGALKVLEAVLIMFGETNGVKRVKDGVTVYDWWETAKTYLNNAPKLKDDMIGYDKENIQESIIRRITKYYNDPEFQVNRVKEVSLALVAMCQWVRAMYDFYWVNKEVEPKREKARGAEAQWAIARQKADESQRKLAEVMRQLQELEDANNRALKEKEELETMIDICEKKLERASKLLNGLSDEKVRWQEMLETYERQQSDMLGNMIVNAGTVAYLGAFTKPFRERLIAEWRNELSRHVIPYTENTDVYTSLGDPITIRIWNQFGLPSDNLSIENAIIMNNSRRWPLMIDPQLQASQWIKNMEKDKSLKVLSATKKDYMGELIRAVQFGNPVLIENIGEDLDPALEPILLKQTFVQNGSNYIKIGEESVPYSNDFRLYLCTKFRNPRYTPETCVKVTLLNFFITPLGLEDQLLAEVVKMEKPELQRLKNDLMQKNSKMRKDLKELQANILRMLSENTGDILENEKLINALGESKVASKDIQEKVEEAETTEREIDVTRNKYRPVAERGSLLFFCASDMTNVDPMYQYSLQWFIHLYKSVIETSEQNDDLEIRMKTLIYNHTLSLYNNVCQSLFEKDKLLFSFVLCIRIMQGRNEIDEHEWRHFLTGGIKTEEDEKQIARKPQSSTWLTDNCWSEIVLLNKLPTFKGFLDSFIQHAGDFKTFFEDPKPNILPIPGGWDPKLTEFQKIMALKVIRPDKVIESIQTFVEAKLDKNFITPPRFDLSRSFKDSNCVTPLIFILSQGADPKSELNKFAEQMRVRQLLSVSLGSGTENAAKQAVKDALQNGSWVILQNCHLALGFMPMLEQIVEGFSLEQNHADFRLWLTSMPTPKFPTSVLQNSVKMTLEPPKGLSTNLKGSFDNYDDTFMEHSSKPVEFKKLLFSLTFFHAVIQERRKFGPLGWNIFYEFTAGDLDVCIKQLRIFLEKYEEIPYKVIKFLTGQINYGGRVTDDWDRRNLMTMIEDYITPNTLRDDYKFSPNLDEYVSIKAGDSNEYKEYLESLPNVAHPEIFGLHENAEITYNTAELSNITDTIVALEGSGGKASDDKDIVVGNIANDILGKLPQAYDQELVGKKYQTDYNESMNTVITQEVTRYNKLLKEVRSSLENILKALKGQVVMSAQLESIANSLYNNYVPDVWGKAYPSIMPLSEWVLDFLRRLEFIRDWIDNGIPNVFWINGFFFPQGFLTGQLQNYARKHQVAIDQVSFTFKILNKAEEEQAKTKKPEDGCYLKGLYMEGARWDRENECVTESNPKELYSEMPIIWFKPVANKQPAKGCYECPVYKTLRRAGTLSTTGHSTNYILAMDLPSKMPPEHWIKRGVALICALKYVTSEL
ncbi:hypothetical protein NAEGRDRAFT_78559 [Naegleria gruberi]|uniref:AAA+ ATPase domain-containing protein n=1 Tax=Naegleria gruberi TaxID=5762 RepID=D2V5C5_NAEGR|nr:uncharacterized protein NAEGRDRAFT_78559 [Naegleria gruberi]EFC47930.1 hypothetical protein NAEGRDRAFT_78559 [Naegleria gruberi]|eukprot:XP_002680674.1 hypothetical protein NAEGRDRAFT_78559 [Naegleria gruberi strain NEG-M]